MLYQPSTIQHIDSINTDVCIIGSGAGGAITAANLSKSGKSIVLIEEGPFVTRDTFKTQDERTLFTRMYKLQGNLTTDDQSVRILAGRVYGGSTTVNWMNMFRTPEFVLEEWINDYGLENYAQKHLSKHFEKIEQRLNIHVVPDSDHNPQNRIILDGCKELGIHAEPCKNNSSGCIGCGFCGIGCAYDAKQDMRLTYLQDALSNGITVFTGVRAERIEYITKDKQIIHGIVQGKEYGLSDKHLKIVCQRVVVSGGAMSTPILLQKSGLIKGKNVGKYLRLHPVTAAIGRYDQNIDPSYGIPMSAASFEHRNLDGNGYGFWLEVPPLYPGMAGIGLPGIGEIRRELSYEARKTGIIIVLVRDGADKKSNGEIRWLGKRPSIRYKLSKPDKKHLLHGLANAIEVHFAAGAKDTYTLHSEFTHLTSKNQIPIIFRRRNGPNDLTILSAHPLGTSRMGMNSKTSVVNDRLEMHYYPGIYVIDGSVMPTSLGVNPMLTILTVASRAYELSSNLDL